MSDASWSLTDGPPPPGGFEISPEAQSFIESAKILAEPYKECIAQLRAENERLVLEKAGVEGTRDACEDIIERRDEELTQLRAALAEAHRTLADVEAAGANVAAISSMISGSYPPDLDAEAHMWRRHQKVCNEAGEVMDAVEGAIGENPRKGVTKTWDDVDKELLDTANAALGAYEHNHGNDGSSVAALFAHIARVKVRLYLAIAGRSGAESAEEQRP